jgi:hypothetical protein
MSGHVFTFGRNTRNEFTPLQKQWIHLLRIQHFAALRKVPPLWYARLDMNNTNADDVYLEAGDLDRKYFQPIPVLIYFEVQAPRSDSTKYGTTLNFDQIQSRISEAERLRLATIFDSPPNLYATWEMNAGDLLLWGSRIFQVDAFAPEQYYGPTANPTVWSVKTSAFRRDSGSGVSPVVWPTNPPSAKDVPEWRVVNYPPFLPSGEALPRP